MDNTSGSTPSEQLLTAERGHWPRWRNSALKPAPWWFRGQQLELIDAQERGRLFRDVKSAMVPVPWVEFAIPVCIIPLWLREIGSERTRWLWVVVAAVSVGVLIGTALLRHRNVVTRGRRTLRERADWPLRLDEALAAHDRG